MTTMIWLLFAVATFASLAVLAQSFRRGLSTWRELRHALATCPERQVCLITHVAVVTRPAVQPRPLAPFSRPLPALRAAA
jgi:hypothetical protein